MNATTTSKQKPVSRDSYSIDLHTVFCIELKSFCEHNEYEVCQTMSNICECFNCVAWLCHDIRYKYTFIHEIWIVFVLWRCPSRLDMLNALSLHTRQHPNEYSTLISFRCYSYFTFHFVFVFHLCNFSSTLISSFGIWFALAFTKSNVNTCASVYCVCCVLIYPLNNKTFTSAIDNWALSIFLSSFHEPIPQLSFASFQSFHVHNI